MVIKNGFTDLICDNCHKPYKIRTNSLYRRKQFNRPNLCQKCVRKLVGEKNKINFAKPEMKKKISDGTKNGLKNMSLEKYNDMCKNRHIRKIEEWNSLSDAAKIDRIFKSLSGFKFSNKLFQKFENYFKDFELGKLGYYYNKEIKFNNQSVEHTWDYVIYDKNNKLQALVDLDGSYYHADKCDYDGLHSYEELDESRYLTIPENTKSYIIYEERFDESFDYLINILKLSYDEYINKKYEYFRNTEFPFLKYDDKELNRSFNDLLKMNCNDENHIDNLSLNTRLGDRLIYNFHPSIFHDHYKDKLSPYEIWNDKDKLLELIKSNAILHNHLNPNKLYQSFNLINKVRFISAGKCKLIINKYLSDYDMIFNPFDKYSSIMLATIASDKKYIGLSENSDIFNESLSMLLFLKTNFDKNIKANIINKDILSSTGKYKCLLTYDENDDIIDECLQRFHCDKYVFIVNNVDKYKEYVVEEIINKNCSNEYIIIID